MKIQLLGIHSSFLEEDGLRQIQDNFISPLETGLGTKFEFVQCPGEFSEDALPLVFIRTGGTENIFKSIYKDLPKPVYLLTSGMMNSLAASMEILTFLRQNDVKAEIIHGSVDYITSKITGLYQIQQAKERLKGANLGVIGKPSDWLIASDVDLGTAKQKLGVNLLDIPISEVIERSKTDFQLDTERHMELFSKGFDSIQLQQAVNIYGALKSIIEEYKLSGLALRCFDLLDTIKNTGCIALALLNAEGIPAACEGDVPALLSMMIIQALMDQSSLMVNPSRINIEENSLVVAHCTLPFNMVTDYKLDTHFESGIGVAVDGILPTTSALMFKLSPKLDRYFLSKINIQSNLDEKALCRTQISINLEEDVKYILTESCANHHLITLTDNKVLIDDFMKQILA
jgi:L-fucose isomerase-like protein